MVNNIESILMQLLNNDNIILKEIMNIKDTISSITHRLDSMEEKFNKKFDEIDQRFNSMEEIFNKKFEEIDLNFKIINQRFDKNDSQFLDLQDTIRLRFLMNEQKQSEFAYTLKELQKNNNVI